MVNAGRGRGGGCPALGRVAPRASLARHERHERARPRAGRGGFSRSVATMIVS